MLGMDFLGIDFRSKVKLFYGIIFISRRIAFVIVAFRLKPWGGMQVIILNLMNTGVFIFFSLVKPL